MLQTAKWIWINHEDDCDEYADFRFFVDREEGEYLLEYSCDGNAAVYVGGELAAFGQYPDYPEYKIVEKRKITPFLKAGRNEVRILVWHYGLATSSTYCKAAPGVIFSLLHDGKTIVNSGAGIECRLNPNYKSHYRKFITPQLGYSFFYDANGKETPYFPAVEVEKNCRLHEKPIENLCIGERAESVPLSGGIFDFGRELVGFLELEFYSDCEQTVTVTYSEYLTDKGEVERFTGNRDFSVEYRAVKGRNLYLNPFRRLGLRYLRIASEKSALNIIYAGIREVSYPLKEIVAFRARNPLEQRIYDTSVATLRCCMHDHYEDCPRREQALYAMDSRNQMLCGYYAFKEYPFARANLVLLAKSQRADGLLGICSPITPTTEICIPSFSLIYPVQVWEYIKFSGDESILSEVFSCVKRIMQSFIGRIDESGLIPDFTGGLYWNFYEWKPGSEGTLGRANHELRYHLLLNCFFLYALRYYKKLTAQFGESFDFDESGMRKAIRERFCKNGTFVLGDEYAYPTQLGLALAILSGVADYSYAEQIKSVSGVGEATLSMKMIVYDALLAADGKNLDYVIKDIERDYGYMLDNGATTFWETIEGYKDFDNAGSLCHGWSAIPVVYYNLLKERGF